MFLIQLLLPLADNQGTAFPDAVLEGIQTELCRHFGGLTAYMRAPAKDIWTQKNEQRKDDVVIVEVMAETLDETWWQDFRKHLPPSLLPVLRRPIGG